MKLLTVAEVAAILRSSRQFVYNLCSSGALASYKIGGNVRIAEAHLLDYLASNVNRGNPRTTVPRRRFKSKHF